PELAVAVPRRTLEPRTPARTLSGGLAEAPRPATGGAAPRPVGRSVGGGQRRDREPADRLRSVRARRGVADRAARGPDEPTGRGPSGPRGGGSHRRGPIYADRGR